MNILDNTFFKILWGLIALQSLIFAFDYPIAYTKVSSQYTVAYDIKEGKGKSLNTIFHVIDIFPENSDRDHETMDYEIFESPKGLKISMFLFTYQDSNITFYKQPYFPEIFSDVYNPPPEKYYSS